jgi:hypothetical protein
MGLKQVFFLEIFKVNLTKIENNSDLSVQLDWPFTKPNDLYFNKTAVIATANSSQEYYFIPIGKIKE